MVIYRSHPTWNAPTTDEIVSRLEEAWTRHGAFRNEAHVVDSSGGRVQLSFITWWDDRHFYIGRIEIEPTAERLKNEPPAVQPKRADDGR
jgi:hypothetical protein